MQDARRRRGIRYTILPVDGGARSFVKKRTETELPHDHSTPLKEQRRHPMLALFISVQFRRTQRTRLPSLKDEIVGALVNTTPAIRSVQKLSC